MNAVVAVGISKSQISPLRSRSSCTTSQHCFLNLHALLFLSYYLHSSPLRSAQSQRVSRYKLVSIGLCSNLNGQIMTDLMVAPPKPGDASYPLYQQEVTGIFSSLKRRAAKVRVCLHFRSCSKCCLWFCCLRLMIFRCSLPQRSTR